MSVVNERLNQVLEQAMNYRLQRHNLIVSNVANLETPGYTPVDMSFQDQLRQQLSGPAPAMSGVERTNAVHLNGLAAVGPSQPEVFYDPSGSPRVDGNSVSLDQEMVRMRENSGQYDTMAKIISKRLGFIKYVLGNSR